MYQFQGDNHAEEIKQLLQENKRLLTENNQMLHKMRRATFLAMVWRLVVLLFWITTIFFVYTKYVAPNMSYMQERVADIEEATGGVGSFQKWFDSLRGK